MNPTIFSSSKAAALSASSSAASFSEASASASSSSSSDMPSASNATFAADELDGVFRIESTNDSTQSRHDDHLARDSSVRRRRFISPSFATDGELSTFSEEENDASDDNIQESANSGGINLSFRQSNRRNIFYPSRRVQSPLSDIFRMPISGMKRQCEDKMAEDDDDQKVTTTTTSTPLLYRANCICSSNDNSDDDSTSSSSEESLDQVMSSPRSSKRMCLGRNDSPSSYISLFSVTSPATIDYRGADSVIITPKMLEHPLANSGSLLSL